MPRPPALIPLVLAVAAVSAPVAGDVVTSTRTLMLPLDWSAVPPWDHDVSGVSTFPNNGNEGHIFHVVIPNNQLVSLDQAITIESLTTNLFATIEQNGQPFTCNQELDLRGLTLTAGGTFAGQGAATVLSHFVLDGVEGTVPSVTLGNNADLVLDDGGRLTINGPGVTVLQDGDLIGLHPLASYTFQGGQLRKSGGNLTQVSADATFQGGSIRCESGQIRFVAGETVMLQSTGLSAVNDATIDFSGNVFFTGSAVVSLENALSGVLVKGPFDLTDATLSTSGDGAVRVDGAMGRLIRGTLNGTNACPFVVEPAGTVQSVANEGRLILRGNVTGMASNRGTVDVLPPGATIDANGVLENEEGGSVNVFDDLAVDGEFVNTATCLLAGTISGAGCFRQNGTLDVFFEGGSSTISSTLLSDGGIFLVDRELRLQGGAELRDATATVNGTGVLRFDSGNATIVVDPLTLAGAPENEHAVLSSGTVDGTIDGAGIFGIAGGVFRGTLDTATRQSAGSVRGSRNRNFFTFSGGEILRSSDVPGLVNEDLLVVASGKSTPNVGDASSVEGPALVNASVTRLDDDAALGLVSASVLNSAEWRLGDRARVVAQPPVEESSFVNAGTLLLHQPTSATDASVEVAFDNAGTVVADLGTIRFSDVTQYEESLRVLSGGTWVSANGGRIIIEGAAIESLLGGTIVRYTGPGSALNGLDQLGSVQSGRIELTGGGTLDVTSNDNGGNLTIDPGGDVQDGEVALGPAMGATTLVANDVTVAGTLTVSGDGIVLAETVDVREGGRLQGSGGTVEAAVVSTGTIAPGDPDASVPVGTLTIEGSLDLDTDATLSIDIAGSDDFDILEVTGAAALGGMLRLSAIDPWEPEPGTSFDVLLAAGLTGTFDVVSAPFAHEVLYATDRVTITITGCAGDVNGDGDVSLPDLIAVLSSWGMCEGCPADQNGDGAVDVQDLLAVLSAWGSC